MANRKATDVDTYVGGRINLRRKVLGVSQEKLAAALGVTFQQVQKYETGAIRVSASRLYDMAGALQVPVSYFFEELPPTGDAEAVTADPMRSSEVLELVTAWRRIGPVLQGRVLSLIKAMPPGTP